MKINFLKRGGENTGDETSLQKPISLWNFVFLLLVPILLLGLVFFWSPRVQRSAEAISDAPNQTAWNKLKSFLTTLEGGLFGERDDRINILLLGKGGVQHEGPELTDSIIIANLRPSTGEVALLSVPRDLYVNLGKWGWRKINHANALAEAEKRGSGGAIVSNFVEDAFKIPIHYYIVVDFDGFKDLVNAVGGIKVYVDRSFEDNNFPDAEYKTRLVSFSAGWNYMDGQMALEFARSRHGSNGENTDFARSKRQQKILLTLKDKILSREVLLNPVKITNTAASLKKYVATNLSITEIGRLAEFANNFSDDKVKNIVLDDSPQGLLEAAATEDGQYILQPRGKNWNVLSEIAKNIFEYEKVLPKYVTIPPKIEILNGTRALGLAATWAEKLKARGFLISKTDNADSNGYKKTIIYDYAGRGRETDLKKLERLLNSPITISKPAPNEEQTHFVIILGEDVINYPN